MPSNTTGTSGDAGTNKAKKSFGRHQLNQTHNHGTRASKTHVSLPAKYAQVEDGRKNEREQRTARRANESNENGEVGNDQHDAYRQDD